MEYISYLELPKHWGLASGDSVLLSSDIMQLTFTTIRNGERFDREKFLEAILDTIGPEGCRLPALAESTSIGSTPRAGAGFTSRLVV